MATLLYRIGRVAAARAWLFISAWLVLLGLAAGSYATLGGEMSNEISIPGIPTETVANELTTRFANGAGGATANVLISSDDRSALTDEQKTAVSDMLRELESIPTVVAVIDPFASTQERAKNAELLQHGQRQLEDVRAELDAAQNELDQARSRAEAAGSPPAAIERLDANQAELDGQRTEFDAQVQVSQASRTLVDMSASIRQVSQDGSAAMATVQVDSNPITLDAADAIVDALADADLPGATAFASDLGPAMPQVFGVGEAIGLGIAAITLIVMLGTLIGAGLPLVNALLGVGVGVLASMSISGFTDMNSVTPVLGIMLGLAVGIDYSLFILNRHRTQLRHGVEMHESISLANGTSGNAVIFAGATVLVALLALNVTGIPFLGLMGTVGAICVAVAILVAVTLTPALLGLVGLRILSKKERAAIGGATIANPTTAGRSAARKPAREMSTARAVVTLGAGLVALLAIAAPALQMRLGLPDSGSEPVDSAAHQSYRIIEDAFGSGANGPLLVTAELSEPVSDPGELLAQARVGEAIFALDDVAAVAPGGISEDRRLLAFQVIPSEGPASESTEALVHTLRAGFESLPDATIGVAGNASANIDVSDKLSDALPGYLAIVVGLSLVILVVVFRSILVPVTATLGFVLSVLAAFGGVTAIFQWGWFAEVFGVHNPGPILSFMPTLLIGILFGLAMDYQLFLVSGMREAYVHGAPARLAVVQGLRAGRAVVIAAAIIMVSVFGGFVFSHSIMIQTIGFGLAFGVLIDAFVVRMLLIPAAMHLLGESAWWIPRWLDRLLPDVDVEGAKLERDAPSGRL